MRRIRPDEVDRARRDPRLLDAAEYREAIIRGAYRMSGDAWLRQGNCADAEPDVMYPEPREPIDEALARAHSTRALLELDPTDEADSPEVDGVTWISTDEPPVPTS